MLKKLILLLAALVVSMSTAFAASVDVNTADQATLQTLKGIGPVKSKAIIDERTKNGPFKDADDLASRVKGLGTKSVTTLESEGLTVGGSSAPPKGASAKPAKSAAAPTAAAPAAAAPAPAAPAAAKPSSKTTKLSAATAPASSAAMPASSASDSKAKAKKNKKGKAKAASAPSGA